MWQPQTASIAGNGDNKTFFATKPQLGKNENRIDEIFEPLRCFISHARAIIACRMKPLKLISLTNPNFYSLRTDELFEWKPNRIRSDWVKFDAKSMKRELTAQIEGKF